ncbi:MAG TPA: SRPBCC family protein [Eudoraea sp.]|nr:SRPBCC family protein [Eudoraea sp.]
MKTKKIKGLLLGLALFVLIALVVAFTPPGMESHSDERIIRAPKEIVWAVIADVGNYHQYATGLTGVRIISGEGVGMVRSCSSEEGTWTETCTAWDEGSMYAFDVNTEAGFPFPFKVFNGKWSLEEYGHGATRLRVGFEYQFPQRWMHWIFSEATHTAIREGNQNLMDHWEDKVIADFQAAHR